jgi:hypothetical protein
MNIASAMFLIPISWFKLLIKLAKFPTRQLGAHLPLLYYDGLRP